MITWLLIGFISTLVYALKYTRTFDLQQIMGLLLYTLLGPITTILLYTSKPIKNNLTQHMY
jgi:hypothetical protein